MPTIRKLRGNWQCMIRIINHPNLSRTFKKHEDAKRFERCLRARINPDLLPDVPFISCRMLFRFVIGYYLYCLDIVNVFNIF